MSCHQSPTRTRVTGNGKVRSSWDNVASPHEGGRRIVRRRGDCKHQCGRELGAGRTVNICEPLINVVSRNKPKMLTGLNQNGMWDGIGGCPILRPQAFFPTGEEAEPNRSKGIRVQRGKPHALSKTPPSFRDSRAQATLTGQVVWDAGKSERLAVTARIGARANNARKSPPGNWADFLLVLDGEKLKVGDLMGGCG